ncbi:hypothetical protein GCM10010330_77860 [Streptomyces tendae]|uniref:hypothetical protein n=1 Tax=Streptomyces tendae TaxID=1932 RepID=UPI001679C200|nr:hypothetical protein [Streptomyces tendae]GHB12189.1 hypothetical protein GCM10010330_77860 [Streptomyces tendae]
MASLHDTTTPTTAPTDDGTSTGAGPGRSRPHFPSWQDVPAGIYATETQLKTMDFPRRPGPPAATVKGRDGLGRTATLTLYRIDQSVPTASTAAQLAAARRRADPAARVCADCGARPDRAPIATETYGALCPTCWHIRTLRQRQEEAARDRTAAIRTARALLRHSSRPLGVLHVDYTERGHTPAGTRRSPSAAKVTVIGANGRVLAEPLLRLVSARAKSIPPGAGDPVSGADVLAAVLSKLTVLIWCHRDLDDLSAGLRSQGAAWPLQSHGHVHEMSMLATAWRGEVHQDGARPVALAPGRADRMLYLLNQITDTALSANRK